MRNTMKEAEPVKRKKSYDGLDWVDKME